MIKKNIKIVLVVLMLFLVALSIGLQIFQNRRVRFKQITEIQEVYKVNEGYIYFGRPTCPSCRLFEPIIKLISKERHIDINYFNSDYFRKEKKASDEDLMKVFEKYEVTRIPLLAYVRDGKLYEAFGSELSGNKDQSMVYKEVGDMLNNIEKDKTIKVEYISCILLCIAIVIYQYIVTRIGALTKNMNNILLIPIVTACGFIAFWYSNFKNSGLRLIVDEKFLTLISLFTVVLAISCFLKNKYNLRREKNYEKNI
ncbi:MAG: thioredoxin family protein [Helcococcus sp.]|nr:thioredoxin family protein [Helcococcus sp.]